MNADSKVYILILNWNGWRDTIECLESVFRLDYADFRVIVCDNASQDGSLERIKEWARGEATLTLPDENPLKRFSFPVIPKPVVSAEYDREQAEQGGDLNDVPLVLIRTGANLGFAGGNNVGLRYALARGDFGHVWVLNNDTVVAPDALKHLVDRMACVPEAGMCGSTVLSYYASDRIQCLGGSRYNSWLGTIKPIGNGRPFNSLTDIEPVERNMTYLAGASMLVSRSLLQDVGLMCEDYHMYYEELDWCTRARPLYSLAYAADSIVYHKEGASLGTSTDPMSRSFTSDRYGIRNRIAVTRRHFPYALPTVYIGLGVSALNRVRRRQWDRAWMVVKAMLGIDDPPAQR